MSRVVSSRFCRFSIFLLVFFCRHILTDKMSMIDSDDKLALTFSLIASDDLLLRFMEIRRLSIPSKPQISCQIQLENCRAPCSLFDCYKLPKSIRLIFVEHLKIPSSQIIMYISDLFSSNCWCAQELEKRRRQRRRCKTKPKFKSTSISSKESARLFPSRQSWDAKLPAQDRNSLREHRKKHHNDFFRNIIITVDWTMSRRGLQLFVQTQKLINIHRVFRLLEIS